VFPGHHLFDSLRGRTSRKSLPRLSKFKEAKRRFGDPGELTTQLQQAAPRWDRRRSVLENMGYQPDESALNSSPRFNHGKSLRLRRRRHHPLAKLAFPIVILRITQPKSKNRIG
jgi:hypothetical protein